MARVLGWNGVGAEGFSRCFHWLEVFSRVDGLSPLPLVGSFVDWPGVSGWGLVLGEGYSRYISWIAGFFISFLDPPLSLSVSVGDHLI